GPVLFRCSMNRGPPSSISSITRRPTHAPAASSPRAAAAANRYSITWYTSTTHCTGRPPEPLGRLVPDPPGPVGDDADLQPLRQPQQLDRPLPARPDHVAAGDPADRQPHRRR